MATINVDTTFNQLLPLRWRGFEAPAISFEVSLEQDHVAHEWPDRDGGHIEATGRKPLVFTAKICFRNFVLPGPNETFTPVEMYPGQYRKFLTAAADRTTGDLQHPELGIIKCKLKSFRTAWESSKRDGVDCDVQWIESTEKPEDLAAVLAAPSPISVSATAAADMDAYVGTPKNPGPVAAQIVKSYSYLRPAPAQLPLYEPSLTDLFRKVQSVTDQASLLKRQYGAQIDHIAYRFQGIQDSLYASRDCTMWPAIQTAERAKSALASLKQQLLTSNKPINFYVVPAPVTLANLTASLKQVVEDLIKLNPLLVGAPVIQPFTVVRYYG